MRTKTGTQHIDFVCKIEHEDGGWTCQFCAGGLFACSVCASFEGATTTHCPGYDMDYEQRDDVYEGRRDFRWGRWIDRPSRMSPAWWARHRYRLNLINDYNGRMDVFGRKVKR